MKKSNQLEKQEKIGKPYPNRTLVIENLLLDTFKQERVTTLKGVLRIEL